MALVPGARLGPYEIVSAIGAGGMGEVYRARDTKLQRDVAIKVLPDTLASDGERLARFEREAQLLASLNHPHIAQIYGLEGRDDSPVIVMELVEGLTLADRLVRGPLPVNEALRIATQIAEALDAAHERGVVHRDLKPANIKVRDDGTVKVLDFGLAKAMTPLEREALRLARPEPVEGRARSGQASAERAAASALPTLTSPVGTIAGTILGTAAYMSPEQARGKAVDKRTDIWAFGGVLFEMLTGKRAFEGDTISDVVAAILEHEPDWSALPATTPPTIVKLLRRCLLKDRKERLADIADARFDIVDGASSSDARVISATPAHGWRRRLAVMVPAFAAGALLVWTGNAARSGRTAAPNDPGHVLRFPLYDTDPVIISREEGDLALSPDGRMLAFIGFGEGGSRIWVRQLDGGEPRSIAGTENAGGLCWSPDGQWLAFSANGLIKKVPASGGQAETVEQASPDQRGIATASMTWSQSGTIVYANNGGLWRVPVAGGAPARLAARSSDPAPSGVSFLPNGERFILATQSRDPTRSGTFVADFTGARTKILDSWGPAKYVDGRLLFVRDRVLYASALDGSTFRPVGVPVRIADNVGQTFSGSRGMVVYQSADSSGAQLRWRDRAGNVLGQIERVAGGLRPAISRDGRFVAVAFHGGLWIADVARGVVSPFGTGGNNGSNPTWIPGTDQLIYDRSGFRDGKDVMFVSSVGGGPEKELPEPQLGHSHPTDVSADGRYLVYEGGADGSDIWIYPLKGERKPYPYSETPVTETQPALSPDGRHIAYASNASGRYEVYVEKFPDRGERVQLSLTGGDSPHWRGDGKELFYVASDARMMTVPVNALQPQQVGVASPLFQVFHPNAPSTKPNYDVTPDGQRFIVREIVRRPDPSLFVVVNWSRLLN